MNLLKTGLMIDCRRRTSSNNGPSTFWSKRGLASVYISLLRNGPRTLDQFTDRWSNGVFNLILKSPSVDLYISYEAPKGEQIKVMIKGS